MKKTKYFIGRLFNIGDLEKSIKSATEKRDAWLKENEKQIAKIDNEDIKIISSGNNAIAIIQLTYYPKES